ncbi:unnamed protein product [Allacma fusca]|uniref:Uncharacterized protein n=1 Tax=Allacma fusca TaxID=39272 RepID=A0A8J2JLJ0_9HEXA|nr:unnamed protein product [Allacma fusca]
MFFFLSKRDLKDLKEFVPVVIYDNYNSIDDKFHEEYPEKAFTDLLIWSQTRYRCATESQLKLKHSLITLPWKNMRGTQELSSDTELIILPPIVFPSTPDFKLISNLRVSCHIVTNTNVNVAQDWCERCGSSIKRKLQYYSNVCK